ncbi:intradiol ring-cleavage dioxygenase [Limnohabitans sp.]|uniref:intradiol ring-cleavage dioxygenase n=1 Tax=Limnohabitans sp. TaxID=1907725 RepID=UPI0033421D58
MRNLDEHTITQAVLERFSNTPDPRLKEIIFSLVQHLHDFAREVRLTEEEWLEGIKFLTRAGHITDDKRQEFILISDTLGLSMLTVAMNNQKPDGCTEATVVGPFHVENAPHYNLGDDVGNGAIGAPCFVKGTIKGLDGEPVPGAHIEVWQSDEDGMYDVQKPDLDHSQGRGVLKADAEGNYYFKSILAVAYPIPHDGPVGDMLVATKNHPWRPAHLHFMIKAPGYESLITHVFRHDDQYLDSDAVFGVRQSLITDWIQQPNGEYTLEFNFVLNPVPN